MTYQEAIKVMERWIDYLHAMMHKSSTQFTEDDHEQLDLAFKTIRDGH